MRKLLTFLKTLTAALAVIVLFTACKQLLDDPEDFLSYWASEAFVKDHSISSAARPDGAGVPCVGSSDNVLITLTAHNPKGFSLVMPTSSEPAGIVEFKELSHQPAAGEDYELRQTGSGTLELTYKQDFLKRYEQGSAALNPTITLKAKDGRVFKQTYTFGIKSNSPPPAPKEIIIAKTTETDPHYVLCLKFNSAEMTRKIGTVPIHKDIRKITINDSPYDLLYKEDNSDFQKPYGDSFVERGNVEKLNPSSPDVPSGAWVLYFKTNVPVESSNEQTSYTITLSDREGVTSDSITAELRKRFKVTFDSQGGSIVSDQYIEKDGKVTRPTNPTKEGYDFIGWYKEASYSTQWDFDTNTVTGNMTLYAKWNNGTHIQYKIKHYKQNIVDDDYTIESGDTQTLYGTTNGPITVTPKAYTGFEYDHMDPASPTIEADGSTVVKVYYNRKQIKVTFNLNGGNIGGNTGDVKKTNKYGAPLTVPGPQLQGKTLSGWSPALPSPPTFPANDTTYTAQWTANTYYVHFNGNGNTGGSMSDQTFTYGTAQTLSANGFTKKGHTFDGWAINAGGSNVYYDQQSVINLTDVQNGTVNLYAVWKIETYTVTFSVADGEGTLQGTYGSQTPTAQNGGGTATLTNVPHGTSVSFTATPNDGWELDGWTGVSSSSLTATLTVDSDKTVTVKFKPGTFNLTGGGPDAWKKLKEEAAKTEGSHTIVINGEITATDDEDNHGEITLGRNLTIKGSSSAVLNANGITRIFKLENGKTLILKDITLKNAQVGSTNEGGGVYIDNGGTLIMQGSSTITNCKAGKGGGVYVAGTFKMEGSALVTAESNTDNEVYLESGKTVTVTDTLTNKPAAKIRLADYQKNRVLAVGDAKKENFKLAPDGGNNWRYKKVGNEVKFVTGKLTYTIEKIISVEEHDGSTWAEYYWTMKLDGKNVSVRKPGNSWEPHGNGNYLDINESREVLFDYTDYKTVGAYFLIKEEDHGSSDDLIADVTKDIKYQNDQLKFEGQTISLDQEKSFRLEFRANDGDVDVVCRIRWEDE